MKSLSRSLIATVLTGFLAVSSSVASPIVSISPASIATSPGRSFDVMVDISGVKDLYAFQFDLSFDPAVIAAFGIDEGLFLQSGGGSFFLPGTIDNALGVISFTASSLVGAVPGISGDGTLAVVHLLAVGPASSGLGLSGVSLLDSTLTDIAFTTASGRVEVKGVVPEPAGLVPLGLIALALARLRRSTS